MRRLVALLWAISLLFVLVLTVRRRIAARIQFRRQLQSYYATLDRQAHDQEAQQ